MTDIFPFYSVGHFINQPTKPTEFEVLEFENMTEPDVADVHKLTFYEIIWTESGSSKQTIDYKEYAVRALTKEYPEWMIERQAADRFVK